MSTAAGRTGEDTAARYLARCGFDIVARNVRLARGELDIIARKHDLLLFVEVKAHQNHDSGLMAVTDEKCARLKSAAEAWLAGHPGYATLQCRFDLIILTPRVGFFRRTRQEIDHIEDIIR